MAVRLDDVGLGGEREKPVVVRAVGPGGQVAQDLQGEGALEVVLGRVGENGDAELELREPPQVGDEAVPAAAVVEQVEVLTGPPVGPGDPEGVAGRRARVRGGHGSHLRHQGSVEHVATLDRAVAQLEPEEPAQSAALVHRPPAAVIGLSTGGDTGPEWPTARFVAA